MSRSRRTRRGRRARPQPPVAPTAGPPTPSAQPAMGTVARPLASTGQRRRMVGVTYPHVGGEIRRVLSVSLASFGLLLMLIAVDRLR